MADEKRVPRITLDYQFSTMGNSFFE